MQTHPHLFCSLLILYIILNYMFLSRSQRAGNVKTRGKFSNALEIRKWGTQQHAQATGQHSRAPTAGQQRRVRSGVIGEPLALYGL